MSGSGGRNQRGQNEPPLDANKDFLYSRPSKADNASYDRREFTVQETALIWPSAKLPSRHLGHWVWARRLVARSEEDLQLVQTRDSIFNARSTLFDWGPLTVCH